MATNQTLETGFAQVRRIPSDVSTQLMIHFAQDLFVEMAGADRNLMIFTNRVPKWTIAGSPRLASL